MSTHLPQHVLHSSSTSGLHSSLTHPDDIMWILLTHFSSTFRDWDKLSSFTTKVQGAERIDAAKNAAFTVADNDYLVQITQKHQFLFFRKLDKMLMEVHENKAAHQCSTKMLQSGLLSVYDCTWKVLPNNERRNESVLHIALEFSPSIPIPGFILDGLIQKDTEGTLRELRREAIRRSRLS